MDRSVDSAAAGQMRIGRVDDRVDLLIGDVALHEPNAAGAKVNQHYVVRSGVGLKSNLPADGCLVGFALFQQREDLGDAFGFGKMPFDVLERLKRNEFFSRPGASFDEGPFLIENGPEDRPRVPLDRVADLFGIGPLGPVSVDLQMPLLLKQDGDDVPILAAAEKTHFPMLPPSPRLIFIPGRRSSQF